jgi:Domain found in Dishevelled, Egl-10, and Pleckstrin (DEP)
MEMRFKDFLNDDSIFRLLVHFLNRIEHSGNDRWANQLRLIVQRQVPRPLPQLLVKNASPELLISAIRKSTSLLSTHKYKLRKVKNSFTGQQLVQWLVNTQGLPNRQHAITNARKLLEANLIEPVATRYTCFVALFSWNFRSRTLAAHCAVMPLGAFLLTSLQTFVPCVSSP